MTQMALPPGLILRWAALSGRERQLIGLAAVVLAAAALILGVWQPLQTSRADDLARIARYDRMQLALSQLPDGAVPATDPRPIATILAQTAAAQGLEILRLDTPGPDTATVALQDVSFETLVLWIDGLGRDSGLTVATAAIRQTDTPGFVSAELSLQRALP
jgi:type II secretory pathway component PulM